MDSYRTLPISFGSVPIPLRVWFSVKILTVLEIHTDIGTLPRFSSNSFYQQILAIATFGTAMAQ
jgi:hypothetical protein